jgi:hypothetical protein
VSRSKLLVGFSLAMLIGAWGCDGKDPERLDRVAKKLAEKGRKLADDSQLPKVEVTYPKLEKDKENAEKAKKEPAPTTSLK